MPVKTIKLILICLFCTLSFLPQPGLAAAADSAVAPAPPSPAEIEAVVKTLSDPVAREGLIRQLQIMAQAQQPAADNQVRTAASEALEGIFHRVHRMSQSVLVLVGNIHEIPHVLAWARKQATDPLRRRMWQEVLVNLTVVLGVGYLAFFLMGWGVLRVRRVVMGRPPDHFLLRLLRLVGIFCLDLVPIVAFAVGAYLALGLIDAQEKIGLVAIAWGNAFVIGHGLVAIFNLILSPAAPGLRCSGLADETANYLLIWGKRLGFTTAYGFFALQAALLLGLPPLSYEVLLRLLGALVTLLLIVIILQNRDGVTSYLQQGLAGKGGMADQRAPASGLRYRLARTWHLLALVYVTLLYGVWAFQVEDGFIFLLRATILTLVVTLSVRLALRLLAVAFSRGFQISDELKERFPLLEGRSNRYLVTIHRAVTVVIYTLGTISILQTWGLNAYGWLGSEQGRVLGGTLMAVLGILLVAFLIWEVTNSLIESHLSRKDGQGMELESSPRTRTLLDVARKALTIVLTVVATLMVLSELGVDIAPLLAGAGVLGLAVGFGSQKLVQDVITGVFILLEDQIAVGDVINVGDKGGVVEAVSIRTVRLRDVAGTVHTIPFSAITIVSNLTKNFSYYVMDVGVAYREDVDQVMQVLLDLGQELLQDSDFGSKILEPLEMMGVDAFTDSAVVIRARIKTVACKQWLVGREFNRRMKIRFDELGIEMPFPHTTIYFGENKGGGAAPMLVRIAEQTHTPAAVTAAS
jgi:small conductance mechanosensitive channel